MNMSKPDRPHTAPSASTSTGKRSNTTKAPLSSPQTPEHSSIDLGVITVERFMEDVLKYPPADAIYFDIAPEDEELFRIFLESSPTH